MINYLIGALVATTMAVAQTPQQPPKGTATTKLTSTSVAGGKAKAEPSRPLPEQSLKTKLENRNSAIPGYKKAKDNGQRGVQPKYTPRQTDSGIRKDTMNKHKS